MNYNRILCLVRKEDAEALKRAVNGAFPMVFAKNAREFRKLAGEDAYLVLSLPRTHFDFWKKRALVRALPKHEFTLFQVPDHYPMEPFMNVLMNEKNVVKGQYGAEEIRDHYLGKIPDLWDLRCKQSIPDKAETFALIDKWLAEYSAKHTNINPCLNAKFLRYYFVETMLVSRSQDSPMGMVDDKGNKLSLDVYLYQVLERIAKKLSPSNPVQGTFELTSPVRMAAMIAMGMKNDGQYIRGKQREDIDRMKSGLKNTAKSIPSKCDSEGMPVSTNTWVEEIFSILEKDYDLIPREPLGLTSETAAKMLLRYMSENQMLEKMPTEDAEIEKMVKTVFFSDKLYEYYDSITEEVKD